MTPFSELLAQGAANAWFFIPSAILLGALHGLEPGHSKTMMAAFIIAVRGTVWQAVLLGLAAAVSHTAVVWAVAIAGLTLGPRWNTETSEPWFQLASGVLIVGVALWMGWQVFRSRRPARHDHPHDHDHDHADAGDDHDDAHMQAHARDIAKRFASRQVSTGQIVLFGLTGGLIPCPASITILLLCLQLKQFALGATLVLSFSIGLAATMVAVGVGAALSVRHVTARWPVFDAVVARAPYVSVALIGLVGIYTGYLGWAQLAARA